MQLDIGVIVIYIPFPPTFYNNFDKLTILQLVLDAWLNQE